MGEGGREREMLKLSDTQLVIAQPEMRKTFTKIFATKTRDEWTEIFSSTTTMLRHNTTYLHPLSVFVCVHMQK